MNILKIRVTGQSAVWENPFEIISGSQNYLYIKPIYGPDWDGLDVKFLFRDRNGNEIWNSEANTEVTDGTDGLVRIPASVMQAPYFIIGVLGYGREDKFIPTASLKINVTDDGYDAFAKMNGFSEEEKESLSELLMSEFRTIMDSYAESMIGYQTEETKRAEGEAMRLSAENIRISNEEQRVAAESARNTQEELRVLKEWERNNAENTRVSNEEQRVAAENQRSAKWKDLDSAIEVATAAKNEASQASEEAKNAMANKVDAADLTAVTSENGGNTVDVWEQGAYSLDYGRPENSALRIRTKGYIPTTVKSITTDDKYAFELLAYDETDTYIGSWNVSEFSKTTAEKLTSLDFSLLSAYAYKYKLKFYRLNDAAITPEEGYTHIHFHNEILAKFSEIEGKQAALAKGVEGLKSDVESQQVEIDKLKAEGSALKLDITELITSTTENGGNVSDIWEQGGISETTGNYKETKRIRTIGYLSKNVSRIYADEGYRFYVVFYDDENNYVAFWTKNGINTESDALAVFEFDLSAFSEYNIRLMLRKVDNTAITVEEYTHIHFVNRIDRQIDDNEKVCKELDVRTSEDLNNESLWENGGVDSSNGSLTSSNYNLRTKEYVSDNVSLIYVEKGYYFRLLAYTKTGEWVGIWDGKGFSADPKHTKLFYANIDALKDYNVLILLRRYSSGTIDISEHPNIHFLNRQQAKAFYPTPTLTFIDDDGAKNALENWESICDEIGINITSCLVTGVMRDGENNPQKVSWDDVARLQNKGFEFVSHTHNHINLTERSEEVIHQQLSDSVAALREHGCESRYLVYPYNDINEDLIPIVRQYFSAGVGYGTGSDNVLPIFTYHLRRHSINNPDVTVEKEYNGETVSVASFKSLDTLKGYIDTTLINGGWLIIMTHLRNDDKYYHDAESRQMIIDLCKYAIEKGMKIQKFGEAFERYKNIMENPHTHSVFGDSFYITDCNGVIHSKE